MNKNQNRLRRAKRSRKKMLKRGDIRLTVTRSSNHISAQVFDATGARVLASASTMEASLRKSGVHGGNMKAAASIGALIGERATALNIKKVAFDRAGNQYHGCVKALAEAAREAGLEF